MLVTSRLDEFISLLDIRCYGAQKHAQTLICAHVDNDNECVIIVLKNKSAQRRLHMDYLS